MSSTLHETIVRRFTAEEYHRMAETGVFAPGEKVELIEGVIYRMSPEGERHVAAIELALDRFRELLRGKHRVRSQHPLTLAVDAEPEPDLAVVEDPDPRAYLEAHPKTALLVVEVAETSLQHDRTLKALQYARAEIPEYWVINLVDDRLEMFRDPSAEGYRVTQTLGPHEKVTPVRLPEISIQVAELLP